MGKIVSFAKQRPSNFDVNKQFDLCIKFLMLLFSAFVIGEVNELDCKEMTL